MISRTGGCLPVSLSCSALDFVGTIGTVDLGGAASASKKKVSEAQMDFVSALRTQEGGLAGLYVVADGLGEQCVRSWVTARGKSDGGGCQQRSAASNRHTRSTSWDWTHDLTIIGGLPAVSR